VKRGPPKKSGWTTWWGKAMEWRQKAQKGQTTNIRKGGKKQAAGVVTVKVVDDGGNDRPPEWLGRAITKERL